MRDFIACIRRSPLLMFASEPGAVKPTGKVLHCKWVSLCVCDSSSSLSSTSAIHVLLITAKQYNKNDWCVTRGRMCGEREVCILQRWRVEIHGIVRACVCHKQCSHIFFSVLLLLLLLPPVAERQAMRTIYDFCTRAAHSFYCVFIMIKPSGGA